MLEKILIAVTQFVLVVAAMKKILRVTPLLQV